MSARLLPRLRAPGAVTGLPWRELVIVAVAALAYFGIRNVTAGAPGAAFANARDILDAERALALDWEDEIQAPVASRDWLVTIANWVYIWGHWPVIVTAAVLLYRHRRDRYVLLRNAMFASAAIGFTSFILFPVAPPRLLELGLVDTVTEQSSAYRALQPPGLTNQYAAFPSLHAGWNVLLGIVVFVAATHVAIRVLAVLGPLAMVLAVVATANHFVLDVVGGVVAVLLGLAVARSAGPFVARVRASRSEHRPRPALPGAL